MNPADLPVVGPPRNTEKDYLGQFTDIAGMKVLCIGYSEAEIDTFVAKYRPRSIEVLTNWTEHGDAEVAKYPLTVGDVTARTPYPDDHFDAVLTLSVLEHLGSLRGACEEMRRIVRNGGELLHFFGPVWSAPFGHHCYARPGDRLLDFCQWSMPAHMHLLCSHAEIVEFFLANGYSPDDARLALHWFYETPLINRLFFDAYVDVLGEFFQFDRVELLHNALPAEHLARLREHYPGRRDFGSYGAKCKLIVTK